MVGDFRRPLGAIPGRGRRMFAFLGGTIGSLPPAAREQFLSARTDTMAAGDTVLLGADLVKDPVRLLAASDDAAGVTAEFDKNVLAVLNRELGADFDLKCFRHEARWNTIERRIEMHLRSTCRQRVKIPAAGLRILLEEDETIWTESSHKYRRGEAAEMAKRTGFRSEGQWVDEEWPFAQNMLIAE